MAAMTLRRGAALAAMLAVAVGCGDELDPAWKVKSFRIFGATVDNVTRNNGSPDVAPGETVRLQMVFVDPATTPRNVTVQWVFCASARRSSAGFACDPAGAILRTGADVSFEVPRIAYGRDTFNRARIQGVAIACAGGTLGVDPATMFPRCEGPGAEGWTMTRSVTVRVDESAPLNRNPVITGVFLLGDNGAPDVEIAADGSTRVPRCAAAPCPTRRIEVRVTDDTREQYPGFDNQAMPITQTERIVFGFFTDRGELDGAFRTDTAQTPNGPIVNTWTVPTEPGPARFWLSAQDPRGGYANVQRTVVVE